jgi:guanylate cyclase
MTHAAADRSHSDNTQGTRRARLDAILERLAGIGALPTDDEETRLLKALTVLIAIVILPIAFVWAVLYLALGAWTGWVAVVYAVVSIASMALFARTRNYELFLNIQLWDIVLSPTLSMIATGGLLPPGGVGVWGILAPLGALVFRGPRAGIRWFVVWLALFLGSGILGDLVAGGANQFPTWFSNLMLGLNIAVGGATMFILLALFAQQRIDAQSALQAEHERAEGLLLNILPGSIAERLKRRPGTIADQFDMVSVLFSDVVGFTPRSEGLPAADVVGLLDRLFSEFDVLAERYGLEKIKTIGDSYMVAAGVPTARTDHAHALANLALDMVAAVEPNGAVGDLKLQLRIGINSGPVVAGVIGRKRFLYDLWGDAVNTASRMESAGTPNRVQVTRATHDLIADAFVLEPRGMVAVKGKGEIETWYLTGRR